jgi:hypothetical protein
VKTVVAIVLALFALTGGSATAQPIVEEDAVEYLITNPPDAPIGVAFGRHAAIYQLDRNDPNFVPWLAILQRSLKDGTQVRFAYEVAGQRLTLIEPVP